MSDIDAVIEQLPKAELHIHIEGSLEPELMFALAKRNNVRLAYDSVEALRRAYAFTNLQDFLDLYYQGMSVLLREVDFYDLAMAYLRKAASQNVRYVEFFFDPQGHTSRGIAFETVIAGLTRAQANAEAQLGLRSRMIMCILRHLDEADAERTLDQALGHKDRIIGIGLDSSEVGHPPSKFKNVFRRARDEGFLLVAHAGEEGPPDYVWEAIDVLGIDRIDHGNRSLEDPALVKRIAADGLALTVCPLSNLRLCGVKDMKEHPLRRMLEAGLTVTINSDDPAYFGGYMNENFASVGAALGLSAAELTQIARNGFAASFMPAEEKQGSLGAFDRAMR
ncbi:MAG TPA: adenosine deaminase [Dongiaceae bacterium]|jgi:adenosine deaminase|nr:adenosine deaminase [Dongiaceae bacterium]